MGDYEDGAFVEPDFALQCGTVLPEARLIYRTYGRLSRGSDNVILFPTWFSSGHTQNEWLIGPGLALDPEQYFIVSVNLIGNGVSSSPSNTPPPFNGRCFPPITILDNVRLQRRLLTRQWGIERIALVIGRSMGALVAFQWACYFHDMVSRVLPFSGAPRTSLHNYVFLDAIKSAIEMGLKGNKIDPKDALRLVGRLYAGWALSDEFYRHRLFEAEGYSTIDEYIRGRWEPNFVNRNPFDLLSQIATWQTADISANDRFQGRLERALAASTANAIVMPCRTDLFFPPEDNAEAVAVMPRAELRVIESAWGHRAAAAGSDRRDIDVLQRAIRELLRAD